MDKPAFIRACEEAAKDWPGRLRTAKAKAAAKHMVNLAIAVVVTVVIIAVVIAIAVASRGEGIGRIAAVFAGLFRWAKNSAYRPYWALRRTAKGAVLKQALPTINLEYALHASRFPATAFRSAGLLSSGAALEDHISGQHSGVRFELSESTAGHVKGEDKDDAAVWQGVLLAFAAHKKFKGRTLIVRDGGAVGNFFKGFGKDGERVALEDPRFEDRFEVYGSDQIESRYLLTPTFMERMVELDDRFGRKSIKAAFADNKLLLTIDDRNDRFELDLEEGVKHGEAAKLLTDFEIPCRVIDALKLDANTVV